jgi:hypothetical protein
MADSLLAVHLIGSYSLGDGRWSPLKINAILHPPSILWLVLKSQFLTNLFDSWLDLLDTIHGMIAFAHNANIK